LGFVLEDQVGITWEQISKLAEFTETAEVNMAQYDSPTEYFAAYCTTLTFETLQELLQGKAGNLNKSTLVQLQAEMDRRYSNALAD
jgi:hypothetical protein